MTRRFLLSFLFLGFSGYVYVIILYEHHIYFHKYAINQCFSFLSYFCMQDIFKPAFVSYWSWLHKSNLCCGHTTSHSSLYIYISCYHGVRSIDLSTFCMCIFLYTQLYILSAFSKYSIYMHAYSSVAYLSVVHAVQKQLICSELKVN